MYFVVCVLTAVCFACIPGAGGGQKRAPDPLELESQMILNCCEGAGNGT